jgi:hypothetical protein
VMLCTIAFRVKSTCTPRRKLCPLCEVATRDPSGVVSSYHSEIP